MSVLEFTPHPYFNNYGLGTLYKKASKNLQGQEEREDDERDDGDPDFENGQSEPPENLPKLEKHPPYFLATTTSGFSFSFGGGVNRILTCTDELFRDLVSSGWTGSKSSEKNANAVLGKVFDVMKQLYNSIKY